MATDYTPPPWDEALYNFNQHLKVTSLADKTVRFYQTQLRTLYTGQRTRIYLSTSSGRAS